MKCNNLKYGKRICGRTLMKNKSLIINRRKILKAIPTGAAIAVAGTSDNISKAQSIIPVRFNHGVASGDPLQKKVIIWTRVTPKNKIMIVILLSIGKYQKMMIFQILPIKAPSSQINKEILPLKKM
jgi:hypothetical protein